MSDHYIEVKAHKTKAIDSTLAKKLIAKETVIGVVTTGKITQPAKNLLDAADIAWIENFPEAELQKDK
ncbi:MAG: hypothetical protein WBC69_21440 [Geitlerinemataceae cyanobacterium]